MPTVQVLPPIPEFFDIDGSALDDGYLYVGVVAQDPEANPVDLFWDAALTIPAVQPIRTKDGFPVNNGSPARFYADAETYSILIKNKNGTNIHTIGDSKTWSDLEARLANDLDAAKGADMVGYRGRSVYRTFSEVIRLEDYIAITANVTEAMQAAAAVAQFRTILLPDDSFNGGPLIFTDTITLPHPCAVVGKGKGRTTVIFTGMGGFAGKNGFTIQEGSSRLFETAITDLTIVIRGADGNIGISTPRGNTVFNLNRPTYRIENVVMRGDVMNVDANKQDMYDYGWQTYIDIGDSIGTVIHNCEAYGKYDWTVDPASQNVTAQWVNLSTVQNVGGLLQPRITNFDVIHVPIGVQMGWRVSQPIIGDGQIHRSWIGLNSPNASLGGSNFSVLEGLFFNMQLNSQRNGVVFAASAFMKFDSLRVSRASGGFDHAAGWTGWVLDSVTQFSVYGQMRSSNLGVYVATHNGYRITNCAEGKIDGAIAENCTDGIFLQNSDAITVLDAVFNNCTTGFRYDGTFSDTTIRYPSFGTVTNPHVFEVGVNRAEILILPVDGSRFPGVDVSVTAISTTATTTLTPYVDNWIKRYQGNSGTYTHNIDLVSPTNNRPETWEFKIDTVAGATGGAIVLRRASDSSTIVSLATNGTVQRFYVRVYWNGTNWILLTANVSLA